MQRKRIIYIAHPIGGDIEKNLYSLRKIIREINLSRTDIVPFCPYYADVVSLDDNNPQERERGIQNGMALLQRGFIEEVWLCGHSLTDGMKQEVMMARMMGIPVFAEDGHMYSELQHFLRQNVHENTH